MLSVFIAALLSACSRPPAEQPSAIASGTPAAGTSERDPIDAAAGNLQKLFDQSKNPRPRTPIEPLPPLPGSGAPKLAKEDAPAAAPPIPASRPVAARPPLAPGGLVMGPDSAAPAPVEDARRNTLIDELTRAIETATGPTSEPFRRGVQLAVIEALQPGAAAAALRRLESELSPAEAKALEGLAGALQQVSTGSAAGANPAALAAVLRDTAAGLSASGSISIASVALCQRVESFGRYLPFPQSEFAAGRSQDVIVYTEVEGFAERAWSAATDAPGERLAASSDSAAQWITEVSQEVTLYSADGYQSLHRPEQVVRDVSRRSRRDYYMVQRITLPPTLAIGRYTLKVTIRDKTTGAEAQKNIPISIVEARLASRER